MPVDVCHCLSSSDILLTYNYRILILLNLILNLLRRTLIIWNMHTFHLLLMTLNQYILVGIRIFSRKKSSLCMTFSNVVNNTFLGCWAFTFCDLSDSFVTTSDIKLRTISYHLLLVQHLFELYLLLHFKLLIC